MTIKFRNYMLYGLAAFASLMLCMMPANAMFSMPSHGYEYGTQTVFHIEIPQWVTPSFPAEVIAQKRQDDTYVTAQKTIGLMAPEYVESYQTHGLSFIEARRSS